MNNKYLHDEFDPFLLNEFTKPQIERIYIMLELAYVMGERDQTISLLEERKNL